MSLLGRREAIDKIQLLVNLTTELMEGISYPDGEVDDIVEKEIKPLVQEVTALLDDFEDVYSILDDLDAEFDRMHTRVNRS